MSLPPIVRRLTAAIPLFLAMGSGAQGQTPDYTPIQTALQATGVIEPDGVLHFDLVRGDLTITVSGQQLNSAVAANGYVNFKFIKDDQWYADGSLPALETESSALQAQLSSVSNIDITSVGSQVALESPKLTSVHFEGRSSAKNLANEIAGALALIQNPQENVTSVPQSAQSIITNVDYQENFLEGGGTIALLNNSVLVFTVPRADISRCKLGDVQASASLGVAYTFYVQPLNGNNIAIFSDLALWSNELQPVRNAVAAAGLNIAAVHNNFIDDSHRFYYVNGFEIGDSDTIGASLYNSLVNIIGELDN